MTIYIVKNEHDEEVSAYTDLHRAMDLAEQLQSEFGLPYKIEELICEYGNPTEPGNQ